MSSRMCRRSRCASRVHSPTLRGAGRSGILAARYWPNWNAVTAGDWVCRSRIAPTCRGEVWALREGRLKPMAHIKRPRSAESRIPETLRFFFGGGVAKRKDTRRITLERWRKPQSVKSTNSALPAFIIASAILRLRTSCLEERGAIMPGLRSAGEHFVGLGSAAILAASDVFPCGRMPLLQARSLALWASDRRFLLTARVRISVVRARPCLPRRGRICRRPHREKSDAGRWATPLQRFRRERLASFKAPLLRRSPAACNAIAFLDNVPCPVIMKD